TAKETRRFMGFPLSFIFLSRKYRPAVAASAIGEYASMQRPLDPALQRLDRGLDVLEVRIEAQRRFEGGGRPHPFGFRHHDLGQARERAEVPRLADQRLLDVGDRS